jgi:hypothetical protein
MELTEQLIDFYNGAIILEKLATWADVVANRQSVLERIIAFGAAYEQLVKLHMAGQLDAGTADFSEENLERVKRVIVLLQSGLDSDEARAAAQEVHTLAERCLQGLKSGSRASAQG